MQVSKHLPPVIQDSIDRLEDNGFKIRLHHNPDAEGHTVTPHGELKPYKGLTVMETDSHGVKVSGEAYCSLNDQYSRAAGTHRAFNRFVHELSAALGRDTVRRLLGN